MVRPVSAEFVERPTPTRSTWFTLVAASLVLLNAAMSLRSELFDLRATTTALQTQRLNEAQEAARKTQSARPAVDERLSELRRVRAMPWPEALTALETVASGSVTVNSIVIDVPNGSVRVEVGANETKDIVELAMNLNAGASMSPGEWHWSVVRINASQPNVFVGELTGRRGK